jgi:hypothetical protein
MWVARMGRFALAGLLIVGVAGCSANDAKSSSNSGSEAAGPAIARGPAPLAGGNAPKAAAPLAPADVTRAIIYNGTILVRVKDVDTAAAAAAGLASGAGGYLGGDNRDIDASRSVATMILRVPAGKFDSTVTALGRLGSEQSRNVSTQDVTEQVVDIQSRLKTQQASVTRIRALIANTTSIGQIVTLEDELTSRESDLESMEAQLRSLTDLTTLSTITVTLLGPEARVAATPKHRKTGFVAGLKSGWNGFVKSLTVLLTVLGAVLPFVLAIGIPVLAVAWFVRRRRQPSSPSAQPVVTGPPAG